MEKKRAVILLSGGLDSATTLAIAIRDGYEPYALSFRYGQRHHVELDCAAALVRQGRIERHVIMDIDLRAFGGSALTSDLDVPKNRSSHERQTAIPVTYVPARNTIFLAFALAYAEVLGAHDIFLGVNAIDYSGYPDCRPAFVESFERTANLGTRMGVEGDVPIRIHAPLQHMDKAGIIRTGTALGVDYALTSSCYDPDADGRACGACDSCFLRKKGFLEAGVPDPTRYADDVPHPHPPQSDV